MGADALRERRRVVKKNIVVIACVVVFVLLMILPGFVLYIVGDIANHLIPDKKEGAKDGK